MKDDLTYIIVGVVVGVVLLLVIVALVAFFIIKRRKAKPKLTKKSISSPINNGHVNEVMVGEGYVQFLYIIYKLGIFYELTFYLYTNCCNILMS